MQSDIEVRYSFIHGLNPYKVLSAFDNFSMQFYTIQWNLDTGIPVAIVCLL